MKIIIDKKHKDAIQKACIHLGYEVRFHEIEHNELQVAAYINGDTRAINNTSAFWIGAAFEAEKLFEEQINGVL